MIKDNRNVDYTDLNVIYEDNHILLVEKIVNIPSQEDKTGDIDMLSLCKDYIKNKYNKPGNVYLGLVHRLDRPVGGLMIFAKTSKAASRLSESIRNSKMNKTYLAILKGSLKKKEAQLIDWVIKNEKLNTSKVVLKGTNNAKEAILKYKVIDEKDIDKKKYSLVEIELITGRHHQIRVQMANLGNPLYGDQKYGQSINKVGQQLGLWAYFLEFEHPVTKKIMKFKLLPKDSIWSEFKEIEKLK